MGTHDNPSQQHPSPLIPDSTTGQSSAADPIVIDKVAEFVDRFIFLPVRAQYRLIATWVVVTYQSECFEYAPYLFIHSPEPSCGKSLLLEILAEFVHNPTEVLISPTPAVLFRTAAKFTQLMDEVDSWTNVDELKGVLNAGFKRGGVVVRLDPDGKGGYVPTPHQVYCPRALAGIGLGILHGTTRDRTFIIGMKKQTREERRERFRLKRLKPEIETLRKELAEWAKNHREQVEDCYNRDKFPYLDNFRDRTIDVAQPLAAIHEIAYMEHPRLDKARWELIEAIAATRKDDNGFILDHRILRELLRLAKIDNPLIGTASELAAKCTDLPEKVNEYAISQVLREYGFNTKSIRKDGMPKHRYVVSRDALDDLVTRYASSDQGEEPEQQFAEPTTQQPTEIAAA